MTDLQSLRDAAEKATPGPWHTNWNGHRRTITQNGTNHKLGEMGGQLDSRFVAACDPQTVLSLLDRLDAAERVIAIDEQLYSAGGEDKESQALRLKLAQDHQAALAEYREMSKP